MSIVMHPLTAVDGLPAYSADDYRHVVNPFLFSSKGTAFDCVGGVRAGSPRPLCSLNGLVVTVKPHCGVFTPWDNSGAYTYAITEAASVKVPTSTGVYKIAVVVDDPSQSHGTVPRGMLNVYPATTPDNRIPGLVVAKVLSGVISDAAPILEDDTVLRVPTYNLLSGLAALDGQRAVVTATGLNYVRRDGRWTEAVEVQKESVGGGEVVVLYGRSMCTVQVNGVKTGSGSWDTVTCLQQVKEGYCPRSEVSASLLTENGGSSTGLVTVVPEGTIRIKNMGGSGSDSARRGNVSWPVC